jgi:hypothetical protein
VIKSWYEYYRVIKKLPWILQCDQKVGMNITGRQKSRYEYYRATNKLVWILQGDQKVGMNILPLQNPTGWSKTLYEYNRLIKKLICIKFNAIKTYSRILTVQLQIEPACFFLIQKRKIGIITITVIRDSCQGFFKKLQILPFFLSTFTPYSCS